MNNAYTYAMRKGADEIFPALVELDKKREKNEKVLEAITYRLGKKMEGLNENEIAEPDTYGCECMFLYGFITEQMGTDFSFIAREFLLNDFHNIDFKKGIVQYIKKDNNERSIKLMTRYNILNLMWNSVKQGSEYAKNLFLYLYKTYYGKEYKQLKRFRVISVGEVNAIATNDPDNQSVFDVARVYTMAQLMGIEISDPVERYFKYAALSEFYDVWEGNLSEKMSVDDDDQVADEDDIEDLIDDVTYECNEIRERYHISDKEAIRYLNKVRRYVDYIRDNDCGKAAGDIFNVPGTEDVNFFLGDTLHNLREVFGGDEFTDKEILLFWAVDYIVSLVNYNGKHNNMMMEEILFGGKVDEELHGKSQTLFNPDDAKKGVFCLDGSGKASKNDRNPATDKKDRKNTDKDREKVLTAEIEELRWKLHLQEGEIRGLKSELSDMRKVQEEKDRLFDENKNMRTELAALRNHVYNLTEKEETVETVSVDDMKNTIRDKRIIIIGGDINWINKMKQEFPEWAYVKPSNSGTMDTKIVEKADKVYFFTDTIDHGTYYRYCNVVRDCGTPFGYIHGVNISNITKQLYKELAGG